MVPSAAMYGCSARWHAARTAQKRAPRTRLQALRRGPFHDHRRPVAGDAVEPHHVVERQLVPPVDSPAQARRDMRSGTARWIPQPRAARRRALPRAHGGCAGSHVTTAARRPGASRARRHRAAGPVPETVVCRVTRCGRTTLGISELQRDPSMRRDLATGLCNLTECGLRPAHRRCRRAPPVRAPDRRAHRDTQRPAVAERSHAVSPGCTSSSPTTCSASGRSTAVAYSRPKRGSTLASRRRRPRRRSPRRSPDRARPDATGPDVSPTHRPPRPTPDAAR